MKQILIIAVLTVATVAFSSLAIATNYTIGQNAAPHVLKFMEFFPLQVGASWVYKIEVGDVTPIEYRETNWPQANQAFAERRELQGADETKKAYSLQFRIKGNAASQGPLKYPIGRELTVEKDDLRIFGGAKKVFWAVSLSARFMVIEVRILDSSNGPMGVPVEGDGYQKRMLVFGEKAPTSIKVAGQSPEKMIYRGIETNVIGYVGTECLHVQREVQALEGQSDKLSKRWTEDMWFAKGKGLVRLVQQIDGKTAMTWSLEKFSSESKPIVRSRQAK